MLDCLEATVSWRSLGVLARASGSAVMVGMNVPTSDVP